MKRDLYVPLKKFTVLGIVFIRLSMSKSELKTSFLTKTTPFVEKFSAIFNWKELFDHTRWNVSLSTLSNGPPSGKEAITWLLFFTANLSKETRIQTFLY